MENVFGIDFGTTNSAVVRFYRDKEGKVSLIHYADSSGRPIPSAVAISREDGKVYVGREAKKNRLRLSKTCKYIPSIKRELEKDWKEKIGEKYWTPVSVAAEIFEEMKRIVQEQDGSSLKEAIVAIPVGFNAKQRQRLREAASKKGIRIQSFVTEPTAAFFANYGNLRSCTNVVVFDWGGGTLDVSVLQHEKNKIEELATTGMSLAGNDIDILLARRLHDSIARKKGKENIGFDQMPEDRRDALIAKAEDAKIKLSEDNEAIITLNRYGEMGSVREAIDQFGFAGHISEFVKKAIQQLDQAIEASGVGEANIDRILMVGGSSNLLPLRDELQKRFGDKLYFPESTMWNVGEGAAKLAANPGTYHANQTIGLLLSDGTVFDLLNQNDKVKDWEKKATLGITDTSQEVHLIVTGNKDLHDVAIIEVPTYQFLNEKIELKASVTKDLIFQIEAKSNMKSDAWKIWWQYDHLKLYYAFHKKKNTQRGTGKA